MARSASFRPGSEPFPQNDRFTPSKVQGSFSFLNPTQAVLEIGPGRQKQEEWSSRAESGNRDGIEGFEIIPNVGYLWRSRDNRKGRHPLLVDTSRADNTAPRPTAKPSQMIKTTVKIFTQYPIWDISWLVAYIFTWGSIVWVINGFYSFLPYIDPSVISDHDVLYGGGITAFIGAVLFFEIGSILLMFEAVNENRTGCFGWAIDHLIEAADGGSQLRIIAAEGDCTHHHKNKTNLVGSGSSTTKLRENGRTWQWFPTWFALRTHYLREIGFIASFSQFCGATIFSIAGFTALPGINNKISQPLLNGIFWAPQTIGGSGFIVSGTLYMLETQKTWYTPNFGVLGWHIAFWNLIGGIGFTLCGVLGPIVGNERAQWHAACATFWGSWCFLIGSILQLYESLQKNPVEIMERN